jgi:TatD DNase family protein
MSVFDAHNHLHDARLAPHLTEILAALAPLEVAGAVVNGTREDDWEAVAALARELPWVTPSYGLHPWYAPMRGPGWLEDLRRRLDDDPHAAVGEIGLDRWIEGHDLDDQRTVFTAQLTLAAELDRAVTIHCIQAWGALWEIIRAHPLPRRGFLIHAYSGPLEMMPAFAERGGRFSFSPYFLHPRKTAQREVFRQIPAERLLVETDAPDLRPPDERNHWPLRDAAGQPINHPANLAVAYAGLAEIRGMDANELAESVAATFRELFSATARETTCL